MTTKYECDCTHKIIADDEPFGISYASPGDEFAFPIVVMKKGEYTLLPGSGMEVRHLGEKARKLVAEELVALFGKESVTDLDKGEGER